MNTTCQEMPPDAERTGAALRLRAAVEHLVALALDDLTMQAPPERIAALGAALNRRDVTLALDCNFPVTLITVTARDVRSPDAAPIVLATVEVPPNATATAIN